MITYGRPFSIRRLTALVRHGYTIPGLSTGETTLLPLNPPAQRLKMHSYPVAWTEAALRNKIMRAKANIEGGKDGHVMTRQY